MVANELRLESEIISVVCKPVILLAFVTLFYYSGQAISKGAKASNFKNSKKEIIIGAIAWLLGNILLLGTVLAIMAQGL